MSASSFKAAATAAAILALVVALIVGIGFVATPPTPRGSLEVVPSASPS